MRRDFAFGRETGKQKALRLYTLLFYMYLPFFLNGMLERTCALERKRIYYSNLLDLLNGIKDNGTSYTSDLRNPHSVDVHIVKNTKSHGMKTNGKCVYL